MALELRDVIGILLRTFRATLKRMRLERRKMTRAKPIVKGTGRYRLFHSKRHTTSTTARSLGAQLQV